ncbi:2Fe-2S iron-sulfur cluster binding domain-containing protein [Paraburkholderia sp. LEh10]|nr:2Fe-2S iron-sulfur cluster binding domain-containing protein [Paraburkholderia sp. LEh10]
MVKATYISPDGTSTEIDVPLGTTLMQAATANCIEGIIGDCGGNVSCATCHVLVSSEFVDRLPPMSDAENQMLDYTVAPRQPNSRLSCQVLVTEELDGIVVEIADPQT